MKSTDDISAKIEELRSIGSPSALSKVRELEWVLGLENQPDVEADMLTDILLSSIEPQKDPWEDLPDFVREHKTYTFDRDHAKFKILSKELNEGKILTEDEFHEFQELRWSLKEKTDKARARRGSTPTNPEDKDYEPSTAYLPIPDEEADIAKAHLISSLTPSGKHRPLLDLDMKCAVIPSTTPGHGHLYIDKELSWSQYKKLMKVLVDVGILEPGYRGASIARGYTALRLPWVKKTQAEIDAKKKKEAEEAAA